MKTTAPSAGTPQKPALPRQFSRILGKLLAMTLAESLPVAKTAYANARSGKERHLAMQLRLRLLHEGLAALHAGPAVPDDDTDIIEGTVVHVKPAPAVPVPPPAPPPPPPAPKVRKPKMMRMDLDGDALSQMMNALDDGDDDQP